MYWSRQPTWAGLSQLKFQLFRSCTFFHGQLLHLIRYAPCLHPRGTLSKGFLLKGAANSKRLCDTEPTSAHTARSKDHGQTLQGFPEREDWTAVCGASKVSWDFTSTSVAPRRSPALEDYTWERTFLSIGLCNALKTNLFKLTHLKLNKIDFNLTTYLKTNIILAGVSGSWTLQSACTCKQVPEPSLAAGFPQRGATPGHTALRFHPAPLCGGWCRDTLQGAGVSSRYAALAGLWWSTRKKTQRHPMHEAA